MDRQELDKLRRLGLTETTTLGAKGVRISAQHQRSLPATTRPDRRKTLQAWAEGLNARVAGYGGEVVPGSLSIAGQTVEAIVPIDSIEVIEHDLAKEDIRIDLVVPRQVVPDS